ncbi:hypothetical protein [Sphingobacterium bambusae]|uniref:DUF4374 domain-containing protein n=1 Tax=Sphingobacterium bambusae TaxID=662858 RepID=A0ABW6BK01_9SPHI|nr:hypothetical protein [Sphingobacterium bambusae]WPL50868.1 hypothetical protein SCB77_10455 [Sphingobacterium bambusae]
MKKNLFRAAMFSAVIGSISFASCSKNDSPVDPVEPGTEQPGEEPAARWISLTAAFPNAAGTPGDGGTRAYAISVENAADPNYEVRIFDQDKGFALKSNRTARVQASADGNFLYNIQYTGAEGGVFNKYKVSGEGKYEEVGFELNTAVILGTSPRWTKAAEGIGVGVYAGAATLAYEGTAPNFVYKNRDSEVRIALLDLEATAITNTAQFTFPWSDAERAAGYGVSRIDVPVLNEAKTKVFIGCNVSKVDPTATPTINASGVPSWPTDRNVDGTKTLVLDYPTLRNPKVITSTVSKVNNHAYRTMTQYVGTDGHIYQATATSGSQILKISKETSEYDNSYNFDLNTALGVNGAAIKAWRYIKDGVGIVLYTTADSEGGYVALVNLTARTATKLAIDIEADAGLSSTFGQYQNIGLHGDFAYVPLTASGKDGNIYLVNWKTNEVKKGAKLINQSGSFFIGAY